MQIATLKEENEQLEKEQDSMYTAVEEMKRKRDNPTPPPVVQPVSYGGGGSAWDDNNNDDNDVFNGGLSTAATWGSSSDRASSVSTGFGDCISANNIDNNDGGAGDAKPSIVRYRAVYQFDSRNPDELNLQIGDVVLVDENHESDPGWLTGRLDGRSGLFPEAYVEKMTTAEPPVQSQPVSALSADAAWGTKAVTPGEKPASPGAMPVSSISTNAPPGMEKANNRWTTYGLTFNVNISYIYIQQSPPIATSFITDIRL